MEQETSCVWERETYDPFEGEAPTPPERCTTGKPALYYNCNEHGPVCEHHTCRCRPSLLMERAKTHGGRRCLTQRRVPDAPGWWARIRGRRVHWFKLFTYTNENDQGPKMGWFDPLTEEVRPISDYCRPLTRWCGPIELPLEDDD